MFQLLAAILHTGNVAFVSNDADITTLADPMDVVPVSALLGVNVDDLTMALLTTTQTTHGEVIQSPYTVAQAVENRDAMAKALYARMFAWIVRKANELLGQQLGSQVDQGSTDIGILDIFGFENFEQNSFEQVRGVCIYLFLSSYLKVYLPFSSVCMSPCLSVLQSVCLSLCLIISFGFSPSHSRSISLLSLRR